MAINKKLIHFQKLSTFKAQLAANNILDTSIVFIKDSQQIWTHGQYYSIADAPADNNSYVRKNNGWVLAPSSGIEIYIGKDLPSSDYKVWFNTKDGSLYYYNNGWKELFTGDPTDLSMVDIYGNFRDTATTANCYVVKKAGAYRIPLVYGNAIVNGLTNSASYTKVSGNYSLDFVNGSGTIINTPFIELLVAISSAQLSMADTENVFGNITVSSNTGVTSISNCGYVEFTIDSVPITGANGVISVKNSNGTIIWNWHIWVWPNSLNTVSITNNNSVTYKILPYNLASKWDEGSTIKNWFYLWGRSVPMLCPSSYNSTGNHLNYGVLSFLTESTAVSYSLGIKNPNIFYTGDTANNNNWFDPSIYYNLWDANCAGIGISDNVTVKTVYDPCPPGFKIPNGNTFSGFSPDNGGGWSNGYTWSGSFFPASGYRYYNDGTVRYTGRSGYCWSSAAFSLDASVNLYFDNYGVSPSSYNYRSNGLSVRPVAEL